MKKNILLISFGLILSFGFISCEKCIKCEILGNIPDTSWAYTDTNNLPTTGFTGLVDTNNVFYNEFCGSKSEVEAFESDVKFAAENRQCRIYAIRKLQTFDTMATFMYCGGFQQLAAFEYGLDTLLYTTFADQDAEWVLDTTLLNPATWVCK